MSRLLAGLVLTAAALGLAATPALADKISKQPGNLTVYGNDSAKLFTQEGIDKAKAVLSGTQFDHGLSVTVDTYSKIPENKRSGYNDAKKEQFFRSWAKELATSDRAHGIYILVCRHPGEVTILMDDQTRDRGFTVNNEKELRDTLLKGFREAKGKPEAEEFAQRDSALKSAMEFIVSDLKDTKVQGHGPSGHENTNVAGHRAGGGTGIMGWVCLGLCVLLGVWLVIGVIRALTGGGGGGGGYGPGGGGGGGGGGFFSSLLGGMFGAAAGMWMYNHFMGGGSTFGGPDAYASDNSYGDTDGADTGAGNFSDEGVTGSFDDGSGGDTGDTGGGGDWGDTGGGGDWGGGGDFGGGGDGDF